MKSKRRYQVPFDPDHFARLSRSGEVLSVTETFTRIYQQDHWNGGQSRSGRGASKDQLTDLQRVLPGLLQRLGVQTVLDAPCGDFSVFRDLDLSALSYLGGDIVAPLVQCNQRQFGSDNVRFLHLDLTSGTLPAADLLFCRDCLVHLSFRDIASTLKVFRNSRIRYLAMTTFTGCTVNQDITTGDWRPLNLLLPPFNFPPPRELINENCSEAGNVFRDKCLGLWEREAVPAGLGSESETSG